MTCSRSKSQMVLIVSIAVACCLLTAAGKSSAQVWGVWGDPAPVAPGTYTGSGHLLVGDLVGLMGQVRIGLNERADIGIQIGIPDFDFDFGFAGDLRYLLMPASDSFPVNLSADGAFGYTKVGSSGGASVNLMDIAFGAIVSNTIETQGGLVLVPYGSLMIDIGKFSVDAPDPPAGLTPAQLQAYNAAANSADRTDTDLNFRGGCDVAVNEQLSVNGELNFSTRDGYIFLTFGAGFKF